MVTRPILRAVELRQYTLPALADLLRTCTHVPHSHYRAQSEEVLLELSQRYERLASAMADLDALRDNSFWKHSPFREPFTDLAQTTTADIARLIAEAQMLRA